MAAMDFEVHPIGAVVPLFLDYRFKDVVDIVLTAKQELSPAKPVHLFGAGHPMALSLFVLLGCDLFDSAAYVLYARDNRYLTVSGTKKLEEMAYLPCRWPVCRRHTPQSLLALPPEKRVRELSLHNLHVTYEEFARIRQAIHEGSLWDYVEMRVRGHPKLYFAFKEVSKYRRFIQAYDPLVKRSTPFYTGIESRSRPVFATARARASERLPAPSVTLRHPLFGAMPASLCHTYGSLPTTSTAEALAPASLTGARSHIRAPTECVRSQPAPMSSPPSERGTVCSSSARQARNACTASCRHPRTASWWTMRLHHS
jgi:7-cyano-7-deazaguanine tRNA-ribosyltransferase